MCVCVSVYFTGASLCMFLCRQISVHIQHVMGKL